MISAYRKGLLCVLLCSGISILWGVSIGRARSAWIDFRAVYAGTRCLIHGHNPYKMDELEREYLSEDGPRPPGRGEYYQAVVLCINLPATFVFAAPFAMLSWAPAHVLWTLLTCCAFFGALLLMWDAGARCAPRVSTLLACAIALNCESLVSGGNAGGIVVGLCGIAVWCFLKDHFVWIGVLCLALCLAVKPHDAGPIWLYFVLAGPAYRKRAMLSLAVTALIGLAAVLWVSHVAPHWMQDLKANLDTTTARGGINDAGPDSASGRTFYAIVDLQSAVSIFRDDPRFYNIVSYLICGALSFLWFVRTLRVRFTIPGAWLALAAVIAFALLITYHRPWDAKLTMLAIPACCMLWAGRGWMGKVALSVTAAAALFAGDIPLMTFSTMADSLRADKAGIGAQFLTLVLRRPETIALLAMGLFYLWVYARTDAFGRECPGKRIAS